MMPPLHEPTLNPEEAHSGPGVSGLLPPTATTRGQAMYFVG